MFLKFCHKFTLLLPGLLVWGCGYHLRGAEREFFKRNEIRTLYVSPVNNTSYKAGVEITVYNALRKRIAQGGYVKIVDDRNAADATIMATVKQADYTPAGVTTTDQIAPLKTGSKSVQIATSYDVNLGIYFELVKMNNKKVLWQDELSRSKNFSASTYLGPLGSTSALINESDFERTLSDLAVSIVTDAEESVNTIF